MKALHRPNGYAACVVAVLALGCGTSSEYCGSPDADGVKLKASDDAASLNAEPGEAVFSVEVLSTEQCHPSFLLADLYVDITTTDSIGKSTRAVNDVNLLVAALVDRDGDSRLSPGDALRLQEGPAATVPPGYKWTVRLLLRHAGQQGGSGLGLTQVTLE